MKDERFLLAVARAVSISSLFLVQLKKGLQSARPVVSQLYEKPTPVVFQQARERELTQAVAVRVLEASSNYH